MNAYADDLVRWLGEQFDEDERIVRAIPADLGHSWSDPGPWVMAGNGGGGREAEVARAAEGLEMALAEHVTHHMAEHDPARVLREVDAKRQILRALESAEVSLRNTVPGREPHELMTGSTNSLRAIVRMLATVYADRPGYRAEWRP